MTGHPEKHQISESQLQAIFDNKIKPLLFANAKAVKHPVAVVFGGQPGAGKSVLVNQATKAFYLTGRCVEISGDDLREYHPAYAKLMAEDDKTAAFYTDRDIGRWVEKAIEEGKKQRVNMVIEGTMRNSDVVAATLNGLREAGYQTEARILAVNWRLSEQGILQRYEGQKRDRGSGRMTTKEAHQAAYSGMLDTVERIEKEQLADKITLCRRGGEVIYSNVLENGKYRDKPRGREVLADERGRPMTVQECREYAEGYDNLIQQLEKPERQASNEEMQHMASLQRDAQRLLQQAQTAAKEQHALLDAASVEQAWDVSLKQYAEAKHAQVERLEGRLQNLVTDQQNRLQQTQSQRPGMLSMPARKKAWQQTLQSQQQTLNQLQKRLTSISTLRRETEMGSPKIEELATRKLRLKQPALASSWDAMREQERLRRLQELQAKQEEERRQAQERERQRQKQMQEQSQFIQSEPPTPSQTQGRGRSLGRRIGR